MNTPQRWLARILGRIVKLMGPANEDRTSGQNRRTGARPSHDALASPWRVYRLYAKPPHLLLRNEQGKVIDLGVVRINALKFNYRLNSGGVRGDDFLSLGALLDHAASLMGSSQIESELKRLPDCTRSGGVDLEHSQHLDISLKLEA